MRWEKRRDTLFGNPSAASRLIFRQWILSRGFCVLLAFDAKTIQESSWDTLFWGMSHRAREDSSWSTSRSSSRVIVRSLYRFFLSLFLVISYRKTRGSVNWDAVSTFIQFLLRDIEWITEIGRRDGAAVLANQVNSDGRLIGWEERRDDGPDGFREAKKAVRTAQLHRLVHGLEEAEERRAHVWHTHRNRRADGRPSVEAVPWTTYLWWGRHVRIFLLSLFHSPLFLFVVGFPRRISLTYPAVQSCSASLHRNSSQIPRRSFLHGKSWNLKFCGITKPHRRLFFPFFFLFY